MERLIVLAAIFIVIGGIGTAKKADNIEISQDENLVDQIRDTQHDEFDSEDKMNEKTENGKDVRIIKEKKIFGSSDDGGPYWPGATLKWNDDSDGDAYDLLITVTIPSKSVEQGAYREDNEAKGPIDQLDDRKQVNTIDPETVDDIQAGKADEGRKEIAVKMLNEEGGVAGNSEGEKERGITINNKVVELAQSNDNQIGDEVIAISKRSARKGRNPQTGKEIKIPARDEDGGDEAMVTVPIEVSELAMEGKVKFFNEEKGYAIIKDNENGEEYFVHVTGLIDEIRDEDDVSFELHEGRKGMNAVDVRRTD